MVTTIVTMPTRYGASAVPSRRVHCDRCSQPTWLSARAPADLDARVICVVCAMAVVQAGDLLQPAPWVADDLAEYARSWQPRHRRA
jgi:hypothetical protein